MVSKIDSLMLGIVNGRLEAVRNGETGSEGDDLLGLMLSAAEGWEEDILELNRASAVNNGKLFYFAGQDTVSNAWLFVMLMLALHPEWRNRARKEVLEVLNADENFNPGVLSRLKVVQTSIPWSILLQDGKSSGSVLDF